MQQGFDRYRWLAGPALVALLASAGCNRKADPIDGALQAIRDGSAKAAFQRYFDSRRQCAPILSYWQEERLLQAAPDNPGVPALVAAGLIERVQHQPHNGNLLYRPVEAARKWFRPDPGNDGAPLLCFARRQVRDVSLVPDLDRASLRYTFDLVDPAPWMARPDMRAAFPGAARSFDATFAGAESVMFSKGRPVLQPIYPEYLNPPFLNYNVDFTGYDDVDGPVPASPKDKQRN